MADAEGNFSKEMQRLVDEARSEMAALRATGNAARSEGTMQTDHLADEIRALQVLGDKTISKLVQFEEQLAQHTRALEGIHRIQTLLEQAREVEDAHQRLFNALHEELKGYKDSFLFEALQKPFIKDLIAFHDDLASAGHQIIQARDAMRNHGLDPAAIASALEISAVNIENLMHLLIEILNRLDVTREETSTGLVDKRKHKVISTKAIDTPEDDGRIVESLRPGFSWRGRVLRPEEVRILRFG
jgi:molecular chaperone GrpE (heat shock protein)